MICTSRTDTEIAGLQLRARRFILSKRIKKYRATTSLLPVHVYIMLTKLYKIITLHHQATLCQQSLI